MKSENPVETANSLREAVSAMIEAGMYNVASLNDMLMPVYNAEVQAGFMTKERMEKLEEILEKAKSVGDDQERRLQYYLAMFEVLTERRFAACHRDTDNIYTELSPHNAKLWHELQENHRELEKSKDRLPKESFEHYQSLFENMQSTFVTNVKRKRQLKEFAAELDEDVRRGKRKPYQAVHLRSIIEELEELVDAPLDDDEDVVQAREMRYRELLGAMSGELKGAGGSAYEEGSRAEKIASYLQDLRLAYIEEITRPGALDGEKNILDKEAGLFVSSLGEITKDMDDAEVIELEKQTLRHGALELKQYRMRHHLMIIEPVWHAPKSLVQDPNAVFFSGPPRYQTLVKTVCKARGLTVLPEQRTGTEYARLRWQQVWTANIGIFDLTNYKRDAPIKEATRDAAICYELGMAFACGRSCIVLAREPVGEEENLPFDIDIAPCILGGEDDEDTLGEAIDFALYSTQRGTSESSLAATMEYAVEILKGKSNWWSGKLINDPVQVRRLLQRDFGSGIGLHMVALPTWPGSYPDPQKPRCFHIMPFREKLQWTVDVVAELCERSEINYIRGDQVIDPDIIGSIWDEVCRATHVIVDITDMNSNALLELGIAHTLGRNIILITQNDPSASDIPSLAKTRFHKYSQEGTKNTHSLENVLGEFLWNEQMTGTRYLR